MSQIEIPTGWTEEKIVDLIHSISLSRKKIKTSNYNKIGKIPIIDQSKKFIVGYTDNLESLINVSDPLIVFGDHTRIVKYIDFDFAPGADGTKVLKIDERIIPKYFYYYLKSIKLENLGYSRHFKILKKEMIVFPNDKHIQVKIVKKLDYLLDNIESKKKEILQLENKIMSNLLPNPKSRNGMGTIPPIIRTSFEYVLEQAMNGEFFENYENPEFTQNYFSILQKKQPKIATEINSEKNLLSNINKNFIQSHPLDEYLPKGWIWSELDVLCTKLTDGTHFSPKNYAKGDYLYLTAKNIRPFHLDLSKITYIGKEDHESIYSRCNPQKGDVLYIKDGVTTGIAVVNELDCEFSMLSSVALLKPEKIIDPYFLMYYLNSPIVFNRMVGRMSGAAITRITLQKIKKIEVRLPPIDIQRKIVKKMSNFEKEFTEIKKKILELSDKHHTTLLHLHNLEGAILMRAFSGNLTN